MAVDTGHVRAADPPADEKARAVEAQMTDEERFSLLYSLMVVVFGGGREPRVPADVPQIAGYVQGVERLGVPPLKISDAGLGVTNPGGGRPGDTATALPAGLALASTFNLALARASGALVGREVREKGFNVLCGGGMTLVRDPRCGRNFEYLSEDPWLSAVIAAETVIGTQSQGVVSMLKHISLNCNETNKFTLDALIDPAAHRESDLLAFQIAIERAEPGSAHVCLQQNQRRLLLRERADAERAQGTDRVQGLGDVRLEGGLRLGVRAGGPRPALWRAT